MEDKNATCPVCGDDPGMLANRETLGDDVICARCGAELTVEMEEDNGGVNLNHILWTDKNGSYLWQPMQTVPKQTPVLISNPDWHHRFSGIAILYDDGWRYFDSNIPISACDYENGLLPTHWMPLSPARPA